MNYFEDKIKCLFKEKSNIAEDLINIIDSYSEEEKVSLAPEVLYQVMMDLEGDSQEEDVWDKLLSIIMPDKISDNVIEYLFQNKIALMRLCHMELPDKWLKKLMLYDDAPLYTLAKRYYLQDQYSSSEFICFYQQYLRQRNYISIHLLDIYKDASKQEVLLYLCSQDPEFVDKKKLEWYLIASQLKTMADTNKITDIYEKNKNVSIIMRSVSGNLFTPNEVLLELSTTKGITDAVEIRKLSKDTLKLKNIITAK